MLSLLILFACGKEPSPGDTGGGDDPPPLGMPLQPDGVTYAGAAVVDLTPEILETWTDLDGDSLFGGCLDDPTGASCEGEPFDDVDGDDWFDAVWIGGFSPLRPAVEVHDPVYARAVVLARDGEYVAFVALDFVGLGSPRIHEARDRLVAEGFDPDRLVVASSHNHQGPDTMGLWGNPYNFVDPVSGIDPAYQDRVTDGIEQAVREAAQAMQPVELTIGSVRMRDRDPWFSGAPWGGKNPVDKMHGMIYDGRDPVIVSDQLLVVQGNATAEGVGTVFTLTNWSGHPEVWGGDNNAISSDWVGVTRTVLEATYGGTALHLPECLGGMQSALNGDLPLVAEDGTHLYQEGTTDEEGEPVPQWAERDSYDFVRSHGWHIAEAAIAALAQGQALVPDPLRVEAESFYIPVTNVAYNLLGPSGIFDLGLEDAVTDPDLCPWAGDDTEMGCLEVRTSRLQLGDLGLVAVPGELLPELAWGLPVDDARWAAEVADPTARGEGALYFPQHDADCDAVDYEDCRSTDQVGDCDCLSMHALPYRLHDDASVPPLLEPLDTPYKAVVGMADNYLSYIVPEPDFNMHVSLLTSDGDHYEDTVSPTWEFAPELQAAQGRIAERW